LSALSTISRFKNLDEFGKLVESMDDYRLLPIWTEYADRKVRSARVYGMTNITKNRVTMSCGPKYPVFGHREALGYVFKDLVKKDTEVHGSIVTLGDTTWTKILFDGVSVKDETDREVELGIEFVNPMDKKTRFKGHAYTFRQTCSNGAGIRRNFPGLEINESHTTNMEIIVPPMIYDFIDRSFQQKDRLQGMVKDAIGTKISFVNRPSIVATLTGVFGGVAERHVRGISAHVESLDPTRWDLFNAANFYTSHHQISPVVQEQIDSAAEQFLDPVYQIVPAIAREVSDEPR
jgi:hypothetical protein